MAKFPTEVTESVVVPVPLAEAYAFFWDVPTSAHCIPGLDRCETGGSDVYRFVFAERSTGPISMCVTYTARYTGNGSDEIRFESTGPSTTTPTSTAWSASSVSTLITPA